MPKGVTKFKPPFHLEDNAYLVDSEGRPNGYHHDPEKAQQMLTECNASFGVVKGPESGCER